MTDGWLMDAVQAVWDREERLRPLNDRIWGEGNWIECPTCPLDDEGYRVFHHRNAHLTIHQRP